MVKPTDPFEALDLIIVALRQSDDEGVYEIALAAKDGFRQLKEQNLNLHQTILDLKKETDPQKGMVFEGNCYWKPEGDKKIGPFCSRCLDKDKDWVRMSTSTNTYRCPACNHWVVRAP